MILIRRLLTFCLASVLLCSLANAQQSTSSQSATVPRLVNFSGKATDAQGKVISGIAGATFAIYKDEVGGSPLWLETQNVTADGKGNYTVQLGAAKPDSLPLDLFSSGEARWLGVTINGGKEQPRVLLMSVPYALKAADAETIGGLPPSAFVLATVPSSSAATNAADSSTPTPSTTLSGTFNVTTTDGTVNAIPLFTTATNIQNSILTQTSATAVNVGGKLNLPATGTATASKGYNSQPQDFVASVFNSATVTAVAQTFQFQAEPVNNDKTTASGTLNLLYASGTNAPAETGLKINNKGIFTFASGQIFPGTGNGTVTSVGLSAPASDFKVTGSPVKSSGTLALNWNVAPTSSDTANAIVKRDASGNFIANSITASGQLFARALSGNGNAISGSSAASNATVIYGGASSTTGATWAIEGENFSNDPGAYGVFGRDYSAGIGVVGQNTSSGIGVFGTAPGGLGFSTDSNVQQARAMGGWVKAMAFVNPANASPIVSCFNSTLTGAAATTPPCGFSYERASSGDFVIDFGFQVDDRFFSVADVYNTYIATVCTDTVGIACNFITPPNLTAVEVTTFGPNIAGTFTAFDSSFFLVVF